IRFLRSHLRSDAPIRGWADEPKPTAHPLTLAVAHLVPRDEKWRDWVSLHPNLTGHYAGLHQFFTQLRETHDDLVWLRYGIGQARTSRDEKRVPWAVDHEWASGLHETRGFAEAYGALSSSRTGGVGGITQFLGLVWPLKDMPRVEVVEAFRQITTGSEG